jgi:hypothetical protein
MFKNRGALTTKEAVSPQAVFRVTPKIIFDDVDLYTREGLAVNFLRELIFALRRTSLFEDKRGSAPRCGGGYILIVSDL